VKEHYSTDVKTSQINDPVRYVVCGDSTSQQMWSARLDAWQVCTVGGCADWANCSWSQLCGLSPDNVKQFWTDPSYRARYTRHMGGSNIGFADGHAGWFPAEAIMNDTPSAWNRDGRRIRGFGAQLYPSEWEGYCP